MASTCSSFMENYCCRVEVTTSICLKGAGMNFIQKNLEIGLWVMGSFQSVGTLQTDNFQWKNCQFVMLISFGSL